MPSPTKRVSRWLHNCSFSSSVSLLFVAILLISIVIAFLEFKSDRAIQKTSERQATFFKLNRHLANIGQEVQSIRGQQLHQKIHPGSVANDLSLRFLDFSERSSALSGSLAESSFPGLNQSFLRFRETFARYQISSQAIIALQQKLGFPEAPGLGAKLRRTGSRINEGFAAIGRNDLIVEFNAIQFTEREYQRTLNMQLSDEILRKLETLQEQWNRSKTESVTQIPIANELDRYLQMAKQLGELVLEFELLSAQATLEFNRAVRPLRATEIAMDQKLVLLGQELLAKRQDAAHLQMLTLIASAVLILLLISILLRGNLQIRYRLKGLASDIRSSTSDKSSHPISKADAPNDDLAIVAEEFGQMSTKLVEQIAAIEKARDNAHEANEAKSRFVATVSHEVRTPMNGLLATLQLMEQTELNDEQRDYVDIMRLSGDRMIELLSDLLDFSKVDADKIILREEAFSLEKCANEAVSLFEATAQTKGVSLSLSLHNLPTGQLVGDCSRLRQVLLNLISNAIKYTDSGEVRLGINCALGDGRIGPHGDFPDVVKVQFSVHDTGIGIPIEEQALLFDPFSQVDGTLTRRHAGTGLGLAICDRLVNLAGGTLRVASEVGVGSTFHFQLPFKRATTVLESNSHKPKVLLPKDLASDVPIQILLAEDDPTTRRTMQRLFKRLGYNPLIVKNGKEAVEAVQDGHIDLIFMDMQMPVLDGLRAATRIREISAGASPTIIGLSGNASHADQIRCKNAGMSDFLAKPFDLEKFVDLIRHWGAEKSPPSDL